MIVKQNLKFPEGIATAEVLKTGEEGGNFIKFLMAGGLIGAILKLCEQGFRLWEGVLEKAAVLGNKGYAFFGMNTSPALIAVGYIVGIRILVWSLLEGQLPGGLLLLCILPYLAMMAQ